VAGERSEQRLHRVLLLTAACSTVLSGLSGCRSPVPFYAPGHDRATAVLGLGGPVPYVGTAGTVDEIDTAGRPVAAAAIPGSGPAGEPNATAAGTAPEVYAWTRRGMLGEAVRGLSARVWAPNPRDGTLDVIDQRTLRTVHRIKVGGTPQQVVPSWDLKTLWLIDGTGGSVTRVDPRTGRHGPAVPVDSPKDLYFTPDGTTALVMVGRQPRIDFRDPRTMRLRASLPLPCGGVRHADFAPDGAFLVASCRLSGRLVRVDPRRREVTGVLTLGPGAAPQDVRLSPDGTVFYVSDMARDGVWLVDARRFSHVGFIRTGAGAEGLHLSRDAEALYVSNTGDGTIAVVDFARRKVVRRWRLPAGGSPGTGGVSADGTVLWLPDRSLARAYKISTRTGAVIGRIDIGEGPRALCVYPQPGRHSLGHTGNLR
jgi:DNA-binding beta-propeller fold protein YncE